MSDDVWVRISPMSPIAHQFAGDSKVSRCGHAWRTRGQWPDDRGRHCQHCDPAAWGKGLPNLAVDRDADAAYVELRRGTVARTVELGYGINVDLDADGVPLGYEILSLHAGGGAS